MESGRIRRGLPAGAHLAAGLVFVLLLTVAGRYGFHRDELYFIEGGRHPAWAQPDNPMLVPLLAAGWHHLVGGRLWAFRILPALAIACFVLISAATARELGGDRRRQTAAAVITALTGVTLATGHLFSTATFDLAVTSAALWLLIKAVRTDRLGVWVALGLTAGVAMEIKILAAPILACCLIGVLIIGPRRILRSPRPWLAIGIAVLLAAPNLLWQAANGWPMAGIAANIAAGGSTSSADRASLVPLHLLQVGPFICAVMIIGVVWLLLPGRRQRSGWLAVCYLCFVILVLITGGKPYYPAAFVPALMAAGAIALLDWVLARLWRRIVAVTLLITTAISTPVLTLPIAPVGSPIFQIATAVNPDSGETVGWDDHVRTVAGVADSISRPSTGSGGGTGSENGSGSADGVVIITTNYGEAGALSRARRMPGGPELPPVYSGHNAYGMWGPPPEGTRQVILVGQFDPAELSQWFGGCRQVAELASPPGVDNEEDGAPVRICTEPRRPWAQLWSSIRRLG